MEPFETLPNCKNKKGQRSKKKCCTAIETNLEAEAKTGSDTSRRAESRRAKRFLKDARRKKLHQKVKEKEDEGRRKKNDSC